MFWMYSKHVHTKREERTDAFYASGLFWVKIPLGESFVCFGGAFLSDHFLCLLVRSLRYASTWNYAFGGGPDRKVSELSGFLLSDFSLVSRQNRSLSFGKIKSNNTLRPSKDMVSFLFVDEGSVFCLSWNYEFSPRETGSWKEKKKRHKKEIDDDDGLYSRLGVIRMSSGVPTT